MTADEALATERVLPLISGCLPKQDGDDIVVCGRRPAARSPYRIPEGLGEEPGARSRLLPGEVSRASAEPLSFAPCGIFEGQRRCSKREAAEYGYGEGRDPVTFLLKMIGEHPGGDGTASPGPR